MAVSEGRSATREVRAKQVVVSGASGLLGTALTELLSANGHEVVRLVRGKPPGAGEVAWDPSAGKLDSEEVASADAFIHLSGENVSEGRWSDERRKRIIDSRTQTTELIARTIAKMKKKPSVFVSASAIGFYGSRGDDLLDETSPTGGDFLAEVCRRWEASTAEASDAGVRTVKLRFGVVLSVRGGALAKILPIFKMGLGGRVGDGRQYMSWVSMPDAIRASSFALSEDGLSGAVNVVAPNPVTNRELASTLGRVLGRPSFFPVPKIAIDIAFGEMGRETVLASQRVTPRKLLDAGFKFEHATLESALRFELGRPAA